MKNCDICKKVVTDEKDSFGYEESDPETFETVRSYRLCIRCEEKKGFGW